MNNTNVRMVRKPADDRGSARLALVIQLGVLLTLTTLFTAVMWINRQPCIETRQVLQNAPAHTRVRLGRVVCFREADMIAWRESLSETGVAR